MPKYGMEHMNDLLWLLAMLANFQTSFTKHEHKRHKTLFVTLMSTLRRLNLNPQV